MNKLLLVAQVYLVTGGAASSSGTHRQLDSTELLTHRTSAWVYSGKLPSPRSNSPTAATLDNRVIITGKTLRLL